MNDHLKVVFKEILPTLEDVGIEYWVYGGVATAAVKGNFFRYNNDVDIFVLEKDFDKSELILKGMCNKKNWRPVSSILKGIRPKVEIFIDEKRKDVFSIVPVYESKDRIEFRFPKSEKFSKDLLEGKKVLVGDYEISIPNYKLVKDLFCVHLNNLIKNGKWKKRIDLREKYFKDAEVLLTEKEIKYYFN